MKINLAKYRRAREQQAENVKAETKKRLSLIRSLIETETRHRERSSRGITEHVTMGYGASTVYKLLKYVRGVKLVRTSPVRVYPTHASRLGYKLACLKELKSYRTDREKVLFKTMLEFPIEELEWVEKNIGRIRCATRYRNERQLDANREQEEAAIIPATELEEDRELEVSKKGVANWLRSCTMRRKHQPKVRIAKRRKKLVHGGVSPSDYARSILSFGQFAEKRYDDAKDEKKKVVKHKPIKVDMLPDGRVTLNGQVAIASEFRGPRWLNAHLKPTGRFKRHLRKLARVAGKTNHIVFAGRNFNI